MLALRVENGDAFAVRLESCRRDPAFSAIDAHPVFGEFGRAYYPAAFGERRLAGGFVVSEGDTPLVVVPCTSGEGLLDYYGMPIRLFLRADAEDAVARRAIAEAFSYIDALAAERYATEVSICDDLSPDGLSLIGKQCLNRRSLAALRLTGLCALDRGEAGMRQGLRKSFQSLINSGRRDLRIEIVDAENADLNLFARYRDFHALTAGRVTRSDLSWQVMFDWIAAGRGELVLGYLADGEMVTGTMVVDGAAQAYYASGVYDRERFDQPLGHWPLWLAVSRSAKRGMRIFDLGDLPLPESGSDKEFAIGYFKRGFATNIRTGVAWRWVVA